MKKLNQEEYEEREFLSQAVRCSSCEKALREVANKILALAMKIEQRRMFLEKKPVINNIDE